MGEVLRRVCAALCSGLLLGMLGPADARAQSESRTYPLTPPAGGGSDPGASGRAAVVVNPKGPDTMVAFFRDLAPRTCFVTFLSHPTGEAAAPGSLLGQFCTDERGRGRIAVVTELVNGFMIVHGREGASTEAAERTIETSVIRVYRARPDAALPTAFGSAPDLPGGSHALSSTPIR